MNRKTFLVISKKLNNLNALQMRQIQYDEKFGTRSTLNIFFTVKHRWIIFDQTSDKFSRLFVFVSLHIPTPTISPHLVYVHLKNACYLYSACSNPINVVLVIVIVIDLVITHRSTLAVPISSTLAYNHTPDNH